LYVTTKASVGSNTTGHPLCESVHVNTGVNFPSGHKIFS
jgi:hypothetical protein